MWIVALALRRPYTFVVMALLILILTPVVMLRTPTDIFPEHQYSGDQHCLELQGLSPQDMSDRITSITERGADHAGERHRAHRVAVAERGRGGQDIFPAVGQHSNGAGAGDGDFPDAAAHACRRERRRRWSFSIPRRAFPSCKSE